MTADSYIKDYKAFIFDLDNVIYPKRDFLLQVYYLFAQFIEYTEQLNAQEIIEFMKTEYEAAGAPGLFQKTAARFQIPEKYEENYLLLHQNAKLPLKLLLFDAVKRFMQDVIVNRKDLFLLVSGYPELQLNKLRQIEWEGLDQYLVVYFADEIATKPATDSLEYLIESHNLTKADILMIGTGLEDQQMAKAAGINFLQVDKLF